MQEFNDNMSNINKPKLNLILKQFKITYFPDFVKFNMKV